MKVSLEQEFNYGGIALIAILKEPRDLALAAQDHWYRIPQDKAPIHAFTHIAFYQPACFKAEGKRITCYAQVRGRAACRRAEIFPDKAGDPRAGRLYCVYELGPLLSLPRPVLNTSAMRVCFAYAPLSRLLGAAELYSVFGIAPVENLLNAALREAGLPFHREHVVLCGSRIKYRLDFALFCRRGKLDVECDGNRFHSPPGQHARDAARDLWLRRRGWTTLRFGEHEVVNSPATCLSEIRTAIRLFGGLR